MKFKYRYEVNSWNLLNIKDTFLKLIPKWTVSSVAPAQQKCATYYLSHLPPSSSSTAQISIGENENFKFFTPARHHRR